MNSLDRIYHELESQVRTLEKQMDRNRTVWNDETRREFDGHYWQDLPESLNDHLLALREMMQTLDDVRQQLGR